MLRRINTKITVLFIIIKQISLVAQSCSTHATPFSGNGMYASNGYYAYPDYNFTATGSTVTINWQSLDNPNRFTIYSPTGATATSGWAGFASFPGPWGASLNTPTTGTFSLTTTCSKDTCWIIRIETIVNLSSGFTDAFSFSAFSAGIAAITPQVTAGSSQTLSCTTTSIGISASSTTSGVNYSWAGPVGGIVSGSTTPTPTVNTAGTYTVTVINPTNGCTNISTVTVSNNSILPTVSVGPSLALNCSTTSGIITASSTTPGVNYSWTGTVVSGSTNDTATVNAAGTYTITITDPSTGCTTSSSVTVTNNNILPAVSVSPSLALNCSTTSGIIAASSATPGVNFSDRKSVV